MSITNRGRELEKNLEGRKGLSDRRGVRGRRIEREKSMDADTSGAEKMRDGGKRDRALAQKDDNPRGEKEGIAKRRGRR